MKIKKFTNIKFSIFYVIGYLYLKRHMFLLFFIKIIEKTTSLKYTKMANFKNEIKLNKLKNHF
ncbi:hypothetical protein H3N56_10900 [Cetobacterium sp. 2A]|nr:hypothetical protein [Cetobacterium sp. 2A]